MSTPEHRLGDRILRALELALDQGQLDAAEHLRRALEEVMTRFGGPDAKDCRDLPAGWETAIDRLDRMVRAAHSGTVES